MGKPLYICIMLLNETKLSAMNTYNLGYAIVDFDNQIINWNFQGYSAKRENAIRARFTAANIDVDYLKTL